MKNLIDFITLNEEIIFPDSKENLIKKIQNNEKKFRIKWSNLSSFKFYSRFSIGTLYMQGFPKIMEGIRGFGKIEKIDNNSTRLILSTKIRFELYFVLILFSIVIFAQIINDTKIPFWSIIIFPVILLWFWLVLRIQEKLLFKKFKKNIKC
ncbi:hypothetical protein [Salegentibacter mishustinae]|uniref:Uncharacterized protein n=1 Tax=Salegentibacter mishustinae TaxID=270918 RepID=A0A0Q9ZMM2_9FLAO|nr:hypothetical protein [Salegentibacter mishustinae]KRG29720.1 hypothetical protein APR42_14865 [Salegentibacter mishustinae]PNW21165.1 hypothetical protein APB85_07815 [Salegentibacter mishustinae]PZX60932.1 hypothetical protein LY54_03130 [Salegentibacter mishustinae]GGW99934.1 hypothetical protein GCM10008086_31360 [Salegentibacter mishustinae]